MSAETTCPACGTVSHFDELSRDASAFCRSCDYPLFWSRSAQLAAVGAGDGTTGLRRLPGTAGRQSVATLECPSCTEPNAITATVCIRCGADMHPAPAVAAPEPAPEPEPTLVEAVPASARPARWPWIALGIAALIAVIGLIALLSIGN